MITDHLIIRESGQYDKEIVQRLRLERLGIDFGARHALLKGVKTLNNVYFATFRTSKNHKSRQLYVTDRIIIIKQ